MIGARPGKNATGHRPGAPSAQNARMQECKNARMQECRNARMHECTNARMHECTNARMHKCRSARIQGRSDAEMQELSIPDPPVAGWSGFVTRARNIACVVTICLVAPPASLPAQRETVASPASRSQAGEQ